MDLKEPTPDDLEAWIKEHDDAISKILEPLKRPAPKQASDNTLSPEQKKEIDKIYEFNETSFACFKEAILRAGFFACHYESDCYEQKRKDFFKFRKLILNDHIKIINKAKKLLKKIYGFLEANIRRKNFSDVQFPHKIQDILTLSKDKSKRVKS